MISRIFEKISNKLTIEQTYLQKIQSIKQGLMYDLLSGKKKLNVEEELVTPNCKLIMAKKKEVTPKEGFNEILLYTTPNGKVKVEIYLQNETIWLTQQKIADLFGVDRTVVTKHIGNIFKEGELKEEVVCANFAHTTQHGAIKGKTQEAVSKFYNLDMIISVGYRVNSTQATSFRIWATERLKEYIIKGFTMDDERLKNPRNIFGKDYFEEQLARIRDIRTSERRFYQKITDIYNNCANQWKRQKTVVICFQNVSLTKEKTTLTQLQR